MNRSTRILWACLCLVAAMVPFTALAKTGDTGEPIALIALRPAASGEKNAEPLCADLKSENGYLLAYKGIAMLDRSAAHPVLITQCWSLRLGRLVKTYLNWDQVAVFQIIDPNVSF